MLQLLFYIYLTPHYAAFYSVLQFIMPTVFLFLAQIRHPHHLDNQTRPTSEMLRSLSLARFRIELLPCETSLPPRLVDCIHEILPKRSIHLGSFRLLWTGLLGDVLHVVSQVNSKISQT